MKLSHIRRLFPSFDVSAAKRSASRKERQAKNRELARDLDTLTAEDRHLGQGFIAETLMTASSENTVVYEPQFPAREPSRVATVAIARKAKGQRRLFKEVLQVPVFSMAQ